MTTVTKLHATSYMTDTETRIEFDFEPNAEAGSVFVTVRPFDTTLQWWSVPPTETVRRWVDDAIRDYGFRRDGARIELSAGFGAWRYLYGARKV